MTSLASGWSAVVVAGVAEGVTSVAVEPSRGRLYWASPGAVTTATLAGDNVENILSLTRCAIVLYDLELYQ